MQTHLVALGCGIYIGTYYNCEPFLDKMKTLLQKYFPKQD